MALVETKYMEKGPVLPGHCRVQENQLRNRKWTVCVVYFEEDLDRSRIRPVCKARWQPRRRETPLWVHGMNPHGKHCIQSPDLHQLGEEHQHARCRAIFSLVR